MGWLQKLKHGLSKSSQKVSESLKSLTSLSSLMGASKLDASSIEEVEDALIGADLGTRRSWDNVRRSWGKFLISGVSY